MQRRQITVFLVTVLIFWWMRVSILISVGLDGDGLWDGGLGFGRRGLHQRLIQKLLKFLLVQLTSGCCHTGEFKPRKQHKPLKFTDRGNTHRQWDRCGRHISEAEPSTLHQSEMKRPSRPRGLCPSFLWLSEDGGEIKVLNTNTLRSTDLLLWYL